MPAPYVANSMQGTIWLAVLCHFISLRSIPEFDQTRTGYQHTSDLSSIYDDPNLGHSGNAGPPGPQPGGHDMFPDFPWPLDANMTYPTQDFNFQMNPIPPTAVNHGSNPAILPHTVPQQHQWGTGGHFSPVNLSQNDFGATPLFGPAGYTNPIGLPDLMQQSRSSSTVRNGQSNFPESGTRAVDGG